MLLSTYILVAGVTLFSSTSSTYIYKWVDDKGVTHYTQEEPAGIIAEKIDVQTLQPKKIGSVSPVLRKTTGKVEPSSITLESQRQAKAICEKAQHNLKLLQTHTRLLKQSDTSSEPIALTEEERQASIKQEQRRIDSFCN